VEFIQSGEKKKQKNAFEPEILAFFAVFASFVPSLAAFCDEESLDRPLHNAFTRLKRSNQAGQTSRLNVA